MEYKISHADWKYLDCWYSGDIHIIPTVWINDFQFVFTEDCLMWRNPSADALTDTEFLDAFRIAAQLHDKFKKAQQLYHLEHQILSGESGLQVRIKIDDVVQILDKWSYSKEKANQDYLTWKWCLSDEDFCFPHTRIFLQALHKYSMVNPGYIYLVQSVTGHYKIGKAKDVNNRLRTFNVKLPFEVELLHTISCRDYTAAERELHTRYAALRVNGSEFFALAAADVAEIKAIGEM